MILKDYIAHLQQMIKDDPTHATLQVVAAIDDEGNGFNPVYYTPTLGQYEDRDFIGVNNFEEYNEDYDTECSVNAVCIN